MNPSIRTPDHRLRVFVSSTLQELAPERAVVRDAIQRIRLTPVMFELGARAHPPRDLYRAYLAQSDVFVGIYWQRYGWIAPGESISGLEDEYRLAGPKPKLVYVKQCVDRESRLGDLITQIQSADVSYRPFDSAEELAELVQTDLAVMLTERFSAADAQAADTDPATDVPPPWLPPVERGALVGRDVWVERALALLQDPKGSPILTLTGPGGTGKTRLGVHLANACTDRFADGVFYVALAGVRVAADVAPTIATTLQVPSPPTGSDPEGLVQGYLRSRSALLVLDNFEHVLDAAGVVARLVAACPRLVVVVTSREALRIRGERELAVPPLPCVGAGLTPAMVLFTQRAQEMRSDFAIDDENRGAVAEICRRLDGLPLAIELAAARIRVLSPQAMLPRLDRSLALLKGGHRDLPERHQTLRAALSWSHDLLSPAERVFFRRLGTFVGGFSEEAAAATVGECELDALDGLTSLVDKSLLVRSEVAGEPRFHLLETVREYALELLVEAKDERSCRLRHLAWVTDHIDRPALMRAHDRLVKERVALELDNARAALRFAAGADGDAEGAWRLFCLYAGARIADAAIRDVIEAGALLAKIPRSSDPVLAAACQGVFAWARVAIMDLGATTDLAESVAVLAAARERKWLPGIATAHAMLLAYAEPEQALAKLQGAIALSVETQQEAIEAWGRSVLCQFLLASGDVEGAMRETETFLARTRDLGDDEGAAFATSMLARLQFVGGDLATSRETYARAVALARERAGTWARLDALTGLASATFALGDDVAARSVLEEILFLGARLGAHGAELLLGATACLLARAGEIENAGLLMGLVPPGFEESGDPLLSAQDPTGAFLALTREARQRVGSVRAPTLPLDEVVRRVLGK